MVGFCFCFLDYFTLLSQLPSQSMVARVAGSGQTDWQQLWVPELMPLPKKGLAGAGTSEQHLFSLPGDREFSSLSAPGCSLDTIPTPPNFVKSNNDAGKALSFQLLTYCRNLYAGSVGRELQGSSLSDWLLGRKSQRQGVCLFQISYHQSLDHLAVSNGYEWRTPGNSLSRYLKHTEETLQCFTQSLV